MKSHNIVTFFTMCYKEENIKYKLKTYDGGLSCFVYTKWPNYFFRVRVISK